MNSRVLTVLSGAVQILDCDPCANQDNLPAQQAFASIRLLAWRPTVLGPLAQFQALKSGVQTCIDVACRFAHA
jgi:hypothetical protein